MSTKIILILSLCAFALHLSLASSKGEFKIATRAFVRFEQGTNCSREDTKYCQWYALGEKELAITNGHEVKFKFNTTDNRLPPESNMTQVYVSGVITALEMPPDTDHEGLYISSGMIVNYLPERNAEPFWLLEGQVSRLYVKRELQNDWGKRNYMFVEVQVWGELPIKSTEKNKLNTDIKQEL